MYQEFGSFYEYVREYIWFVSLVISVYVSVSQVYEYRFFLCMCVCVCARSRVWRWLSECLCIILSMIVYDWLFVYDCIRRRIYVVNGLVHMQLCRFASCPCERFSFSVCVRNCTCMRTFVRRRSEYASMWTYKRVRVLVCVCLREHRCFFICVRTRVYVWVGLYMSMPSRWYM